MEFTGTRLKRFFVLSSLSFLLCVDMVGQSVDTKVHLGAFYYQGDLAPKPIDLSFGPGNLCWGISIGTNVKDWCTVYSKFMIGRITGDDSFSDEFSRRARNLRFASPLYEYGISTDLLINKLWTGLNKYKLKLYFSTGINLIRFNPQAYYDGRWIELQPLGTEGQTLPDSGKEKYKRYNWSRPIGLIVEFNFSPKIAFGMEVSPRKTWTDYLDDVSENYPDIEAMKAIGNVLGAQLSDRRGEISGTVISPVSGTPRGKPDKNDWFTYFGLHVKYQLFSPKIVIPDLPTESKEVEEKSK